MQSWKNILSWLKKRFISVLDELLAAAVIAALGYLLLLFRAGVEVSDLEQWRAQLTNPYIIIPLLVTGLAIGLLLYRRRSRILSWSLASQARDDDFELFYKEIDAVLKAKGMVVERVAPAGVDFLIKEKHAVGQRTVALLLEPRADLVLNHDNVDAIAHLVRNIGADFAYYLAREPRTYFGNAKIIAAAVDSIVFTSYKDFALEEIDFTNYMRHLVTDWETSAVSSHYIDVAVRDDRGRIFNPVDSFLEELMLRVGSGLRVALLGDFGSGKTTFLRFFAFQLAEKCLDNPVLNLVPILVYLRKYELVDNIEQLILEELTSHGVFPPGDLSITNSRLLHRKIILILDAFDEMTLAVDRLTVQRNLRQIGSAVPSAMPLIVSCRTHFFRDKVEEDQLQAIFPIYLQPWDKVQLIEYLQKALGDRWKTALDFIKDVHNLAELAQTPLFLEMIVGSLDDISITDIHPSDLYEIYTDQWLNLQIYKSILHRNEKAEFMEELAWQMQIEGKRYISSDELRGMIQDKFKLLPAQLDSFENDIRTCSFLNRPRGDAGYAFAHTSFMEYFVARYLAREIRGNEIKNLCTIELTLEVMSFIAQLLDELFIYERLHLWLESKTESEYALARRNIAHILRIISRSPLRKRWIELRESRANEHVHTALHGQNSQGRWQALVALAWLRTDLAVKTAQLLLTDDNETDGRLLRMSALVLGLLGAVKTMDVLIHRMLTAEDFVIRQNCAVSLGYLGDTRAIPKLVQSLFQESDYRVRRSTIWAIETIDPILALDTLAKEASSDPSEEVRQYATLAIGRIGGELALKELSQVLQDPSALVRKAAVESMGRIGGGKALELIEFMINDTDVEVREVALSAANFIRG